MRTPVLVCLALLLGMLENLEGMSTIGLWEWRQEPKGNQALLRVQDLRACFRNRQCSAAGVSYGQKIVASFWPSFKGQNSQLARNKSDHLLEYV